METRDIGSRAVVNNNYLQVCMCVCGCVRDVKKSTSARTPFRPSCVQKPRGVDQR